MAFQRTGELLNLWRFIAGVGFAVQLVTIDTYIPELIPGVRARSRVFHQPVHHLLRGTGGRAAGMAADAGQAAGLRWLALGGVDRFDRGGCGVAADQENSRESAPACPAEAAGRGRGGDDRAQGVRRARPAVAAPQPVPAHEHGSGRFPDIFSAGYGKRTVMLSVFNMTQVIGFYGFAAWVPTLLIARGITLTHSLEYSFVIAIANPIGPLLGTLFADRTERKLQIILGLVVMGLAMLAFAQASRPAVLIALGVLFTLAANVMSYAYHSYQAELYRIRARAIGFVYSWTRLAAAFAGLAIGYFFGAGGVPAVAILIAIAMVVGIVVIGVFGPATKGRAQETINR
ncbi:MFS transporter [Rhodanobacter terrae]|uniref:MFS transporter n=1 Tax=Rhodanobacter terrae TaxID=418647 RepID=A0ABW0T468_9GAMM